MDKKRMTQLIKLADEVLVSSGIKQQNSNDIKDSYNGQTAAFGITVLMSGLVPALVIYYQKPKDNRAEIVEKILQKIGKNNANDNAIKSLLLRLFDEPSNRTEILEEIAKMIGGSYNRQKKIVEYIGKAISNKDTSDINKRVILEAIGQMIGRDSEATALIADRPMNQTIRDADTLLEAAIQCVDVKKGADEKKDADKKTQLKRLSREVVECATALKLIIRTYNLV